MNCPYQLYNVYCPFKAKRNYLMQRYIDNGRQNNTNPLTVSSTPMTKNTDEIREYLQIPIFKGQVNPKILTHINDNIKNDISEFQSQMESAAKDSAANMKKQGKHFVPFEISNNYLTTYNKNNILSVSLIYHQYISGRNSYIRTAYNYDLQTGESMPLRSLFKKGTDYIGTLNKIIREYLKTNSQLYSPNALQNFKGISEDQPYYLDDNNLNIFFGFNEIAPLSGEIPIIKIPFSKLSSILKPQLLRNSFPL